MKNTLGDLNNHLFAQLERLNDEEIKGEELQEEMERSRAVTSIAKEIISNANTLLKVKELQISYCRDENEMPKMLKG